jgi:C-terminal processing protease CtpA/Prc
MKHQFYLTLALSLATIGLHASETAHAHPLAQEASGRLGVQVTRNPRGGLTIHRVLPYSPAAAVGLKPGDVILTIDGTLYSDPKQAQDKVIKSGATITIVYEDGHDSKFYQVTAEFGVLVAADAPGGKQQFTTKKQKKTQVKDPRRK